jgi:Putative peptidoglycan binding domain
MYGLLIRDVDIWEKLNTENNWGVKASQTMLNTVGHDAGSADGKMSEQTRNAVTAFQSSKGLGVDGIVGPNTRKELFAAYMDAICKDGNRQPFKLEKTDFLAQGKGKDLKGDIQGCSEFNPSLLFSKAEKAELDQKDNKSKRDRKNQTNRRVMILLFKPGTEIEPSKWPCPTVKEGVAGCKVRFFSDGEKRRLNTEEERKFDKTKNTFACRFYHRMLETSPCEGVVIGKAMLRIELRDEKGNPIVNEPYVLELNGTVISADGQRTDSRGHLEHEVPLATSKGLLKTQDHTWEIEVRLLPPIEEVVGVQTRLGNLSFFQDQPTTEFTENAKFALRTFQSHVGVLPSGNIDDETVKKLSELHRA